MMRLLLVLVASAPAVKTECRLRAMTVTAAPVIASAWLGPTKGGTGLTSPGSSGQIAVSTGSGFIMQHLDGGTYS